MSTQSIQSSKFHGHQGSVLCLDISDNGRGSSFLLSGSEDMTARLWDLRDHRRRTSLCIQAEGEVLSAAFAPSIQSIRSSSQHHQDVTPKSPVLEGDFALDFTVYLSVENGVYGYDLRNAKVPIIKGPTNNLSPILQNQDEVNQIQLAWYTHSQQQQQHQQKNNNKRKGSSKHKKGNKTSTGSSSSSPSSSLEQPSISMYLAAADDAGKVRFMDTQTLLESSSSPSTTPATATMSQILHHDPNGVAVVPTCAFRPGYSNMNNNNHNRSLELASGGTDCKIHLWDILKPRKPVASYTIRPIVEETETSKPQVCNPPMVHTLAWSPSGHLLASGLGDGTVSINQPKQRSLVQVGLLTSGHDDSVASILFPSFTTTTPSDCSNNNNDDDNQCNNEMVHSQGAERIVMSAGSDGAIFCWDLGSLVGGGGPVGGEAGEEWDPSILFASSLLEQKEKTIKQQSKVNTISDGLDDLSLLGNKPKILFGIPHGSKPNWMVSRKNPATLFVADTSNDITAYTIPLVRP